MRFKIKYHPSICEKYRIFQHRRTHLNAQNKTAKYFLKIKGHTHNIFSYELDKTNEKISLKVCVMCHVHS